MSQREGGPMIPSWMQENIERVQRRQLFGRFSSGLGMAALASLLKSDAQAASQEALGIPPAIAGLPHHAPKAKRVVMLWQGGGPSHVDLFDDKPTLRERQGQDIPDSVRGSTRLSTMSSGYAKWPCIPAIKPHRANGKCGMMLSEMLPKLGA
ncbi:MAG: DUF1501 domain-containing protein, partial [Pirellulaceae bacterium]